MNDCVKNGFKPFPLKPHNINRLIKKKSVFPPIKILVEWNIAMNNYALLQQYITNSIMLSWMLKKALMTYLYVREQPNSAQYWSR